jgi:hypothetical protein
MTQGMPLRLIEDRGDLFEYPIPSAERLESHSFFQFHYRRWCKSEFRQRASHEMRGAFMELIVASQDEGPVGTLPVAEDLLARAADMPLERWREMVQRPIGPLYGWRRCITDLGVIRLYHPVVLEVAQSALKGRMDYLERSAAERERKRLVDLPRKILAAGGSQRMAEDQAYVVRLDQFLLETLPEGRQRRVNVVREAMEQMELQQG